MIYHDDDGSVYIRRRSLGRQLLSKYIVGLDMHFGTSTRLLRARTRLLTIDMGAKKTHNVKVAME